MDAVTFAILKHGEQKYGDLPYVMHLAEVVSILVRELEIDSDIMIAAGWLHDVVEDTDVDYSTLAAIYGHKVADIVDFVSDPDLPTRKERKAEFIRRMSEINIPHEDEVRIRALIIKLADRTANLRAGLREDSDKLDMYVTEDAAFRSLFTAAFLESDLARRAVSLYDAEMSRVKEKVFAS